MSKLEKFLVYLFGCLLILNIAYVWSGTVNFGMSSIDATAIWMFKAKAFFVEGGIPWQTLRNVGFVYQHPQYPIGLPAMMTLVYFAVGRVSESSVIFFYPVIYCGILWLCFRIIKKLGAQTWLALGFTYLYSLFSPLLAGGGRRHAGEADIIITLIVWIILWSVQRMSLQKDAHNQLSWFVVFLIMVASQIKMEGIFLLPVLWFLPTTRMTKAAQSAVAVVPFLLWSFVVKASGLPTDFGFVLPGFSEILLRVGVIVRGILQEFLKLNQWYVFWPIFFLTLILWPQKSRWISTIVIPTSLLMSLLFSAVYLTTTLDTHAHLVSSIDRVLLQLSPWFFVIWVDRVLGRIRGMRGPFSE